MQEEVYVLKDENKGLRKHLKRVTKMREAIARRLIFYQDFVNTKVLEFDEITDGTNLKMSHQNSHISLSKGHRKSK